MARRAERDRVVVPVDLVVGDGLCESPAAIRGEMHFLECRKDALGILRIYSNCLVIPALARNGTREASGRVVIQSRIYPRPVASGVRRSVNPSEPSRAVLHIGGKRLIVRIGGLRKGKVLETGWEIGHIAGREQVGEIG